MKSYTSDNPTYSSSIQEVETSDPAHADNINAAPEQLLQNDLVMKQTLDGLAALGLSVENGKVKQTITT